MNKELWDQVEVLERDLRLLQSVRAIARRCASHLSKPSSACLELVFTIDAVMSEAQTLPEEWLEALNEIGFELEIPLALARETGRRYTRKEAKRVSEAVQRLLDMLDNMINQIEEKTYSIYEQIAKNTSL